MSSTSLAVVEADAVIVSMQRASTALAEARTIQQTKKILDVAAAAEIYARRQKLGEEAEDLAAAIKVEALRKLGEMLQATPKAKGELLRGSRQEPRAEPAPTLADLGLTKKESAVAQKLAALPEDEFAKVRDGHVSVAKAIAAVQSGKPAPASAATDPAPAPASDDDDDAPDVGSLLDEMAEDLRRAESRVAELEKALEADGKKAVADALRRVEHAERRCAELMDDAHRAKARGDRYERTLARIGKAVGQPDLDRVAAAVEAMARAAKKVTA
jgi:hypothetical protein